MRFGMWWKNYKQRNWRSLGLEPGRLVLSPPTLSASGLLGVYLSGCNSVGLLNDVARAMLPLGARSIL